MTKTFDDLPGWNFDIDEISANVYRVKAHDEAGRNVEKTGLNLEKLIEECREFALEHLNSSGQ